MPNLPSQPGIEELTRSEHLGSMTASGDNVDLKKVGVYQFGTNGNWARQPLNLIDSAYDYIGFSNPDANGNYQTLVFNDGGVSGTLVRTLTLGFDVNSNIISVART